MLAEQHDEWTEMRRYIGLDVLAKARQVLEPEQPANDPTDPLEVTPEALTA